MEVGDGRLGENARKEGRNVGRVAGQEDDAETAPDVDEELVRPGFRSLPETKLRDE